jgi:hypothetical protein
MDLDPGPAGPKTCGSGSGSSGSATLPGRGGQTCSPIDWNRWSDLLPYWLEQVVRCPAAPIKCKDSLVADANYNIPHGNIIYVAFNDPDILKRRGNSESREYCRMNNF